MMKKKINLKKNQHTQPHYPVPQTTPEHLHENRIKATSSFNIKKVSPRIIQSSKGYGVTSFLITLSAQESYQLVNPFSKNAVNLHETF